LFRIPVFAALLATSPVAAAQCDLALTNANVWNGSAYEKRTLSIKGGKFISDASTPVSLDASFLYLTPPFADAHTHTIDVPRGPDDATHKRNVAQGVFYALNPNNIRPAGATPTAQPGLVELQATGGGITRTGGHPQPLYTGLAQRGFLGAVKIEDLPGRAFHLADTPDQARAAVRAVKANGASIVKLYLLHHTSKDSSGLSGESFDAAVAEAKAIGLRQIVHIEDAADFRRAVAAKVTALGHMPYEAPTPERPAESYRITAADAAAAAGAGMTIVPTATVVAMRHDGAKLAEVQAIQRHNLTLLRNAKVKLAVGADQYSLGMHDEITTLRSFALFETPEIIAMATINGAELAFPGRKLGRITDGYEASFVAYFFPLTQGWAGQREPAIGMRNGEVMIDTIDYFAKACAKPNAAPAPVPAR
jgi:cytosine/adenosine deaminase-related metal-dependent hydrolase